MEKMKILFLGKENDHNSEIAAGFLQLHFKDVTVVYSNRKNPLADCVYDWEGDFLISYLAQWIIPAAVLEKATWAAINFHPGSPEYPGIGCTNFAIYNREKEFGITCHHMVPMVDSGQIIAVRRFPLFENDTVYSITQRCYTEMLHLFYELISNVLSGKSLPQSTETWKRKAYTRKQLNELCELTPAMNPDEIALRIKATTYGDKQWAFMKPVEDTTKYSSEKK
jgi:methionyl-tRNA formyltransferase